MFLTAIGKGASVRLACLVAGCSTARPYAWLRRGAEEPEGECGEFAREYYQARATVSLAMVERVVLAAGTDWKAAVAYLKAHDESWSGRNRRKERAEARRAEAEADRAEAEARLVEAQAQRAERQVRAMMEEQTSSAPTTRSFLDSLRGAPQKPMEDDADAFGADLRPRIAPAQKYQQKQDGEPLDWPSLAAEGMALKWYDALDISGRARTQDGWHYDVYKRLATAYPVLFAGKYQEVVVGTTGARHRAVLHALEDRLVQEGAIRFIGEAPAEVDGHHDDHANTDDADDLDDE